MRARRRAAAFYIRGGTVDATRNGFSQVHHATGPPGIRDRAKFGAHKNRHGGMRLESTLDDLFDFVMTPSILGERRMTIDGDNANLKRSAPPKPNCPIFKKELKRLGIDFRQRKSIGVFVIRLAKLPTIEVRLIAEVCDAT
jgi:hypothetical protein